MAVHRPERVPGQLPAAGIRECLHFVRFLKIKNMPLPEYINRSAYDICASISEILSSFYPDPKHRDEFIKELIAFKDSKIIPKDNFDWLKKHERACYWAWSYLRLATPSSLGFDKPLETSLVYTHTQNIYNILSLHEKAVNNTERLNLIIEFFDKFETTKSNKLLILNKLKESWGRIFTYITPFKWLDDNNEEQLKWAWSYLLKEAIPPNFIQPTGRHELYLAIIASLDLWDTHEDTRKLFTININKALSQRKFREQIKDRKPINTYLEKKTKIRLEEIAKHYNLNITRTLEKIINEEYERYRNSTI